MSEREGKQAPRISFSKEKVGRYNVGASGITGTTSNVTNPTGKVNFEDGAYNSSDLLVENIEKLGMTISGQQHTISEQSFAIPVKVTQALEFDQIEEELAYTEDEFEDASEEELANNLDKHFERKPPRQPSSTMIKDNFCRLCGNKFAQDDKYCAKCGNHRNIEAFK